MKRLPARYVYALVIASLIITVSLQLVWLAQIYKSQHRQLKTEVEELVSTAAKTTTYNSIARGHEQSARFREFFMSPQWLQLRQSFDDLKVDDLHSEFHYGLTEDSTVVQMRLSFLNHNIRYKPHASHVIDTQLPRVNQLLDVRTFKQMDSTITAALHQAGISTAAYAARYDYDHDRLDSTTAPTKQIQPAFASKHYTYNLKFLHKYQLVLPSLTGTVLYRMRYYLVSSVLMILLTGIAFLVIIKMMRSQQLYAQARFAFTSNMTHELKTPVSTVAIALETISNNHLENHPAMLKNYIEMSRSELRRLNLMIEKVLNLEQADNGEVSYRHELFDVQQGIENVLASMQLQIAHKEAQINWQPLPEPCFVYGDPAHLTNVFYNLTENALKYGGQGVQLHISCSRSHSEVIIKFSDNGPGIEPLYHQRVFDRFFRVPGATANIHQVNGSGLGLNYVKQVIEQHSGWVALQSTKGKGCTFILYLPAAA
ncbi:HAMP domain-containing sensor histidine kinase [Mucilaginibacter sp. CSA2-8R]|uniref:sensor histidine kinase n=1 Tax=Mucilaginibacter sp. CSA2-8R TaxID=3141542 RepID=UPI00315CA416